MDIVHSLQDLTHKELGDRVVTFEIAITQQATKVVVHVRKDHEHVSPLGAVCGIF
jgi:pyridoxine 5'-phosphate synthase PdxJ